MDTEKKKEVKQNKIKIEEIVILSCDVCDIESVKCICGDCERNKLYCEQCWRNSHRHESKSNHSRVQWTHSTFWCSGHRAICDKYCKVCKKMICVSCIVSSCKNHNLSPIANVDNYLMQGLKSNLRSIELVVANLKNVATDIDVKFQEQFGHSSSNNHHADCGKVQDDKERIKSMFTRCRTNMIDALNRSESAMLERVDQVGTENKSTLLAQLDSIAVMIKNLSDLAVEIDSLLGSPHSSASEARWTSVSGALLGVVRCIDSLGVYRTHDSKSDAEVLFIYYCGFVLNKQEMADALKQLALYGNRMARVLLGFALASGSLHFPKNAAKGFQMISSEMSWLQDETSKLNKVAQCNLGVCHEYGEGVEPNIQEAARLYRLAADQGLASAQYNLGDCYDRGQGVEQNLEEAARLYRLAANQGLASAQNNLGICCEYGNGTERNLEEAIQLYRLAADQGLSSAQKNLGVCYEYGEGVERNLEEAVRQYRLAADQGNVAALASLQALNVPLKKVKKPSSSSRKQTLSVK